jgi:Leucine-rich repeat (LRR) protein
MPLRHERPSPEYMRELKAVARSAGALREHLPKVNLLPDGFPLDQVKGYCNALVRLPDGTAEASIGPLRAADSELNRIRQRFIPAHDEDAGHPEPLVPRDSNFDLRLVGLMAAVRAAIERYKVETGEELDTDVTPDRPENPEVDAAKPAAFDDIAVAADNIGQVEAEIAAADPSVVAELENEKRLIVSADVNIGSAAATLSTEAPRPTVLSWLDDNLNSVANEMDRLVEVAGPKVKQVGKEIGGLADELTQIWFPKVTKSIRAVSVSLSNIRAMILGSGDISPIPPPSDFDMAEVYNCLFRNEPVPDRWAPYVTEIENAFDDPEYISRASAKQITEDPDNFFKAELLAPLINLRYLEMPGRKIRSTKKLDKLEKLEVLYFSNGSFDEIFDSETLKSLHTLHMWSNNITQIKYIIELNSLKILSLNENPLIDINPLRFIHNIEILDLSETGVTDISALANLPNLLSLDINKTGVVDIQPLRNLINLETLDLAETKVSDLMPLTPVVKLKRLYLRGTKVTDLAPLANLQNLEMLDLRDTGVSDLAPLEKLSKLRNLRINGTLVTNISPLSHLEDLEIIET